MATEIIWRNGLPLLLIDEQAIVLTETQLAGGKATATLAEFVEFCRSQLDVRQESGRILRTLLRAGGGPEELWNAFKNAPDKESEDADPDDDSLPIPINPNRF